MTEQLHEGQLYAAQSEREIILSDMLIRTIPGADLVRYGNSSSEIVQLALRVARAHTGRRRWVKLEGHYHGWFDSVLASVHPTPAQAGPAERPNAALHSSGQDPSVSADVLVSHFNDLDHLKRIFNDYPGQIAAVLMEPVMCNSGCIVPGAGYLEGVKQLCEKYGSLLIFDETITGFRLAPGGATERFGVTPDLGVYGKGLGGGIPISCLAGTENVMKHIADCTVFHAGTFNTNLLSLRGASATLEVLLSDEGAIYQRWDALGEKLRCGLRELAEKYGVNLLVKGIGQVTYTGFADSDRLESYRDCWDIDGKKVERWVSLLKQHGVRILARGLWYLSAAHAEADIDEALSAADKVLGTMSEEGRQTQ